MSEFSIITDSGCDISADLLSEWNIKSVDLTFMFEGDNKSYVNSDMPISVFYQKMLAGDVAKTAAANIADFRDAFEVELKAGNDIIAVSLSSGISTTYNSARMAAEEMAEEYPDRKIYVVDSLCASAGFGLLLYLIQKKRSEGAGVEETFAYAEEIKGSICHWFTVDDLKYLRRGGRVSTAAALAAAVLNIKPVLHVDDEGHLINVDKVRGRKNSIRAMFDQYKALALNPSEGMYYISHGNCREDAEYLQKLINDEFGKKADVITDIGAIIGSHSGPGTLALFFLGSKR